MLLAGNAPAMAHIRFCNQFSQEIYVAIVYEQFDRNGKHSSWLGRGWLWVGPGGCADFDSALAVSEFYWRAETNLYQVGDKMHRYNWPHENSGDKYFWDVVESFNFYDVDKRPQHANSKFVAYTKSARSETGPISLEITFDKDARVSTSFD